MHLKYVIVLKPFTYNSYIKKIEGSWSKLVELFSSYGEIKTQRHNILLSAGSRGINDSEMLFLIASDTLSVAERGYDPRNPGLWVQTASIAHKRPIRTLSAVWSRGSTFIFLIVHVQQKKKSLSKLISTLV